TSETVPSTVLYTPWQTRTFCLRSRATSREKNHSAINYSLVKTRLDQLLRSKSNIVKILKLTGIAFTKGDITTISKLNFSVLSSYTTSTKTSFYCPPCHHHIKRSEKRAHMADSLMELQETATNWGFQRN